MRIGVSCRGLIQKYGYERGFAICRESGFDAVDLALSVYGKQENPTDIYNASQDEFEAYFANIKKLADQAGIEISSTHGRVLTYTNEEEQCAYTRWVSQRDLAATRILGAPACVIHPIIRSYWPDRWDDEDFLFQINTELYNYLIPFAEANGVKIATETMGKTKIGDGYQVSFFAHPRDIRKQFEILNSQSMTLCVDTGHTNEAHFWGAPSAGEMIRAMGEHVTLLHLHDNNGTADLHLDPICDKRGGVDWPDVFDALDEIGYDGVYNFEITWQRYGDVMEDAARFRGKFLRYIAENRGRV